MEPLQVTAVHSQSWDDLEIANSSNLPFSDESTRSQLYQWQLELWQQDRTQPQDNFEQELFGRTWLMPNFKRGFCILRAANGHDAIHLNNRRSNRGDFIMEFHAETCQSQAKNLRLLLAINNNLLSALDGPITPGPAEQAGSLDPQLSNPRYQQWPRRVDTQAKVYFNRPPTVADFQRLSAEGKLISLAACRMKKSPVPRTQAEAFCEEFNPVPIARTNRGGILESMTWEYGKGGGHSIVMYDKLVEIWNKDTTPGKGQFLRQTSLMCDPNSPEWPKFNACRHTFMAKMENWPQEEIGRLKRDGRWDEDRLWVVEFRLRTPTLRVIGCSDMPSLFYVQDDGALWQYCTEKILRILEYNPDDTNKARWDTAPWWKQIQEIKPLAGAKIQRVCPTKPLLIDAMIRATKAMAQMYALGELDGLTPAEIQHHYHKVRWWELLSNVVDWLN